jgi:phosphoribosyl 1,2-cyclic phosphate phosphodiesterase
MKIRVLGCGSSGGVPLIGCSCAVCASPDPRNKRLRASILVSEGDTHILVDASPDLRQQFLTGRIGAVDAAIITHAHADHLHGIDDLRSVNFMRNASLDLWGAADCLDQVQRRFGYVFNPPPSNTGFWYAPSLTPRTIEGPFKIGAVEIVPMRLSHGVVRDPVLGLKFGKFAYTTDVNRMSDEDLAALSGIDTWLVDCLREEPNPAHSHLAQTLDWIARVRPRRAILTHMNHSVEYAAWTRRMPAGVELAYDGFEVEVGS